MSQLSTKSSVSSSQSQSSQVLSPKLRAVLSCLDIQLEEELTRYRRQRKQIRQTTAAAAPAQALKPSEVLTVASEGQRIEPSEQVETQLPVAEPLTTKRSSRKTLVSKSASAGWESVVMNQSKSPLATRADHHTRIQESEEPAEQGLAGKNPDNYLESSEVLLKTIDEAPTSTTLKQGSQHQRSPMASLLSPVGLLSLLVLLLSSAILGSVLLPAFDPATLRSNRFFKFGSSAPSEPEVESSELVASSNQAEEDRSPNLAVQEFVDLELDTLSNVNPAPNPIPASAVAPPVQPTASVPAAPTIQPTGPSLNNLSEELLPEPTVTTPVAPTAQPPKPAAGAAPQAQSKPVQAADGFYYVVVDYQNEQSLEQSRAVVPDAYVREFKTGTKVQMGALDNATAAQKLTNELKAQGLNPQFDVPTAGG
ncbi:MAG: hypothetical protein ACFBSC_20325 [Microcoleaceae cyanobacterium]